MNLQNCWRDRHRPELSAAGAASVSANVAALFARIAWRCADPKDPSLGGER